MNYTLHQLKIFLAICEHESITKASDALFLTQPAVSIQLKKLQDQFEIPLTEVIGRKLYITDFGRRIAEVSRNILLESEELKFTIDQYKGLLTGKIRFAVVSTGKYVIPYFLRSFLRKHPQIEFRVDVTNKNKVVESLIENDTDFALVSVLPDQVEVISVTLMKNHLYLIGNHEEVSNLGSFPLSPADISGLPLIFREKGSATRMAMENYIQSNNIASGRTMQLVSNEAVKQAVNAGLGFSVMPLIGLRNELIRGELKLVQVKSLPIITRWTLVYNKDKKLSPASRALIDFLQENKDAIIEKHFSWTREFINSDQR